MIGLDLKRKSNTELAMKTERYNNKGAFDRPSQAKEFTE